MNNPPTETCRYIPSKGKSCGSFIFETPNSIKRVDIDFEKIKQKMKRIYEEESKNRRKIIVSDYFILDNCTQETKVYSWGDLTNVKRSTLLKQYFSRKNISFDFKTHRDYIYNNIVFNRKTMTIESLEYRLR